LTFPLRVRPDSSAFWSCIDQSGQGNDTSKGLVFSGQLFYPIEPGRRVRYCIGVCHQISAIAGQAVSHGVAEEVEPTA